MKTISSVILSALFLYGVAAAADPEKPQSFFMPGLEVGTQLTNYRYTEPGLISHSGYLLGVFTRLPMQLRPELVGILDAEFSVGSLLYDGSLCDSNTNQCSAYKAMTNDFIFKTVYRFNFLIADQIQLFAGPGLRYLYDRGAGSGFYTRLGTYFFLPLGININFEGLQGLFNLELEYDLFLCGMMKSKISEVNSTYSDINHKQTKGSGSKALLRYNLKDKNYFISISYENWNVGESNVEPKLVNGVASGSFFVEPKNFTDAVSLGAGFRF